MAGFKGQQSFKTEKKLISIRNLSCNHGKKINSSTIFKALKFAKRML